MNETQVTPMCHVVYHPIQTGVPHSFDLRHVHEDDHTFVECRCGWRREVPRDLCYVLRFGDEPGAAETVGDPR